MKPLCRAWRTSSTTRRNVAGSHPRSAGLNVCDPPESRTFQTTSLIVSIAHSVEAVEGSATVVGSRRARGGSFWFMPRCRAQRATAAPYDLHSSPPPPHETAAPLRSTRRSGSAPGSLDLVEPRARQHQSTGDRRVLARLARVDQRLDVVGERELAGDSCTAGGWRGHNDDPRSSGNTAGDIEGDIPLPRRRCRCRSTRNVTVGPLMPLSPPRRVGRPVQS